MFTRKFYRLLYLLAVISLLFSFFPNHPIYAQAKKETQQDCSIICITDLVSIQVGEQINDRLVFAGNFPEEEIFVSLRAPDDSIAFSGFVYSKAASQLVLNVSRIQWQTGTYTIRASLPYGSRGCNAPYCTTFSFGIEYVPIKGCIRKW